MISTSSSDTKILASQKFKFTRKMQPPAENQTPEKTAAASKKFTSQKTLHTNSRINPQENEIPLPQREITEISSFSEKLLQ